MKAKTIKCDVCGKKCKGLIGLGTHMRKAHGKSKKMQRQPEIRYQEFEIPVKLVITVKVESDAH